MSEAEKPTLKYKLVLLGDTGVGKSSLVLRFVKNQFFQYQESTIGAAFLSQKVVINDTVIKLEIWDTAGQERYASLAPMYYRGADAAIVVYDITAKDSFVRAQQWVQELLQQCDANIVIALAANKADKDEDREIDSKTGKEYADDQNCHYIETSAKNGNNVSELFLAIARKLPKKRKGDEEVNEIVVHEEEDDPSGCAC